MGGGKAGKRLLAGSQPLAGLELPGGWGGVGSALGKALGAGDHRPRHPEGVQRHVHGVLAGEGRGGG